MWSGQSKTVSIIVVSVSSHDVDIDTDEVLKRTKAARSKTLKLHLLYLPRVLNSEEPSEDEPVVCLAEC